MLSSTPTVNKRTTCPNCGEPYTWPSYDCPLCGMLLTVESGKHSDPLGALGLGLISSFLEVLDNTSDSPTARVLIKDVAAGIVAFQPMSLYELFQKVGKGSTVSATSNLAIKQVGALQSWLEGYPCNESATQEDVGSIFLTLALASGSMESIVSMANFFVKVGYIPIVGADLIRSMGFTLDYLHGKILEAYGRWSNAMTMSKWLCERCGTLNQFALGTCDVCAGPRPARQSATASVSIMVGETLRSAHPPPPPSEEEEEGETKEGGGAAGKKRKSIHFSVAENAKIGTTQEVNGNQSQCAVDFKSAPVKTFAGFGQVLFSELEKLSRISLWMERGALASAPLVEPLTIDVRQASMDFLTASIRNHLLDATRTKEVVNDDSTLSLKLMCLLQLLKLNLRRLRTVQDDRKRKRHLATVDGDALLQAFAIVDGSSAMQNDGLKAEILAVQLEMVTIQGPEAILNMMHAAPGNAPVFAGGCAAIDKILAGADLDTNRRISSLPADSGVVGQLQRGNAGPVLLQALSTFGGNMSVVRPALSILAGALEVVEPSEESWRAVVQTMTAVFHNEACLLHCLRVVCHVCQSAAINIENDITRATINLAVNAMRNHMVEDVQEVCISLLLLVVQRGENGPVQYVNYIVDAGGVHTTISGITILEHRHESKRKGLEFLSTCMIDERCFNDVQVPVALDCIDAYPEDNFMLTSCMKIIRMLVEKSAKRQRFVELRGVGYLIRVIMFACHNRSEALGEIAATIVFKYMKRVNQRERGKFGQIVATCPTADEATALCDALGKPPFEKMSTSKRVVSNDTAMGLVSHAMVRLQGSYPWNKAITKATVSSFMLAARALADQAEIDCLFFALRPAQLVEMMGRYVDEPAMQRDGCWLCNYLAESNRDALVKAGGFEAIVAAMQTHPTEETVQIGGCIAIMNVSGQRGGGRGKRARKAGCETAIKHACELLETAGQPESLAAAKLAYKRMNKKCEVM